MDPKYDGVLIGILQNEGEILKFLDVIFGFLMRRTDFFYVRDPGVKEKLGFHPKYAMGMVAQTFDKYQTIFSEYQKRRANIPTPPEKNTASKTVPKKSKPSQKLQKQENKTDCDRTNKEESDKVGRHEHGNIRYYDASPNCYNGAERDTYSWNQQIIDIDIHINIPKEVTSGDQLLVKIEKQHICIIRKENTVPIIDLDLLKEVKMDTAVWYFEPDDQKVHISLDKVEEYWWDAAFEGEPKLNVQRLDCSRPMHELDEEAQAKIAQLLFDEQQKRLGLPTTEEKKLQDLLRGAKIG